MVVVERQLAGLCVRDKEQQKRDIRELMCGSKSRTSFSLNTQLLSRVKIHAAHTFLSFPLSPIIALSTPVSRSPTLLTIIGGEICFWQLIWNSQWMSEPLRALSVLAQLA